MGVIKKRGEQTFTNTTLIFGKVNSGRSHLAIKTAQAFGAEKVLFVSTGAVSADVPEDWDIAQILTWDDIASIRIEAAKNGYDAIILDKYDATLELIPIKSDTPSEQEWGHMAAKWSSQINGFMGITKQLIITVRVIEHPKDGRKIDLTPRALNNLLDKCANRWWTFAAEVEGRKLFGVQMDWLYAENFDATGYVELTYNPDLKPEIKLQTGLDTP
jgi:hypothetical protein